MIFKKKLRKKIQKLIQEFRDDLRHLRHIGLCGKTYDAYIELSEKWRKKQAGVGERSNPPDLRLLSVKGDTKSDTQGFSCS